MSGQYLVVPLSPAQFPPIAVPSPAQCLSRFSPQPKGEDTLTQRHGRLIGRNAKRVEPVFMPRGNQSATAHTNCHRCGSPPVLIQCHGPIPLGIGYLAIMIPVITTTRMPIAI